MNLNCESIYKYLSNIDKGSTIDLSGCRFIHPWALVFICSLLSERHNLPDKKIILPKDKESLKYLKHVHFNEILKKLSYFEEADQLEKAVISETDSPNIAKLRYSKSRDEFQARLGKFLRVFESFGLDENEARLVTALVGELGNNVFDHNQFHWPLDITGCFTIAQNYPKLKMVEFAISDTGIGFLGTLKGKFPDLKDDVSAIKFGLEGNSGWFEGKRGNGLINIKDWTFLKFGGNICIHSGEGFVSLDKKQILEKKVYKITGTIVHVMLYY